MKGWQSSNMDTYVPPKEFKYVRNEYTNIYEWMDKHPEANCYYCGKPREVHELHFNFFAPPTVLGICRLCFPDFRIGNLATDRFVVERILGKYNRRSDVISWFQRNQYELHEADRSDDPEYDWAAYDFPNNPVRYFEFLSRTRRSEPLPGGGYLTNEELAEFGRLLEDSTRIEIFKDGHIHIVY
jgi:hypothetical protein